MIFSKVFSCLTFLSILSLTSFAAPEILNIRQHADSVERFDKFEVGINIKADFINPFDPDEIDISATFTSPSGKAFLIYGFYDYSSGTMWKLRFAPTETGVWKYVITVKDKTGKDVSDIKSFKAVSSPWHGILKIATNQRYLEFTDGTPFYGVGLWYNDGYSGYNSGRIKAEELDNLKELGVNFISTYIAPLESIGSGIGRYDQNLCGRLDEILDLLEKRDMQLSLNLWFHSYLSETVWGGGNIRWETNPYQQITAAKDFYKSNEAWTYQEKLYRYMIARWGYSRALGIWFIVDEVNGTDGWVSGDSLQAAAWGKKVHDYLKSNDPYQRLTTGTRSGGITEFWHEGYQVFDIAAREIYERQGFAINNTSTMDSAVSHPLRDSYTNYAGEIKKLWNGYNKPAIIGETGWDHTFYEPSMPGYLAQYHNALWVCLSTGAAMTPFWWAFSNMTNDAVLTNQLASIRNFTDSINFSKLSNLNSASISSSAGDAYAIKGDQVTFGWVANPESDVAGLRVTVSSLKNGRYKLRLYHTWRGRFLSEEEISVKNGSVTFQIPRLFGTGSHANYIGEDAAFILELSQ
ncbi:hypothetical protein BH20BAC1_BH20BAC1_09430 [soil metagenome]